jgi:vanillate O-demethylase ferredoxin subunit
MVKNLDRMELVVSDVICEANDVLVFELRSPSGAPLPPFEPGAHLEVHLANGLIRHYSLCNDSRERHRFRIGVGLARESRGGSKFLHHSQRLGSTLSVVGPRNNFPLAQDAAPSLFVAGGIGITPIMAMIRACVAMGTDWRLVYCVRNRQRAAFLEELCEIDAARVTVHADDEHKGSFLDIPELLARVPESTHIYCCGPAPLMTAVEKAAEGRPASHVHFEWFTAKPVEPEPALKAFTVLIRSSGQQFEVSPGKSILEVLEENGLSVPYSCREGLCATCVTGVLSGTPDHRDGVLSDEEHAANDRMAICVSRSLTETIELDL